MSYEIRVYKIYFDDCDDIYIGSTKANLSQRMAQHRVAVRKGSTCRVHNFIRSKNMNFNYILVSSCMVSNKDQQRQFEQTVISEMKPNLNQVRAYATEDQKIERQREYYSENKEQKKEYQKVYKKNNKEQIKELYNKNKKSILENAKEYYNKNKKSILEKNKIKIKCPYCDTYTRRSDISRHNKNKTHKKNIYLFYHNFIHS